MTEVEVTQEVVGLRLEEADAAIELVGHGYPLIVREERSYECRVMAANFSYVGKLTGAEFSVAIAYTCSKSESRRGEQQGKDVETHLGRFSEAGTDPLEREKKILKKRSRRAA